MASQIAVKQGVGLSVEEPHLTIPSTSSGETLTFACNVDGIKHLPIAFVSFLSVLNRIQWWRFWVESWCPNFSWMCARCAFISNTSLEGDNGLPSGVFVTFFYPTFSIRLQHGPRTCSISPSFWRVDDSQLCTNWVSPEQESRPCHVCSRAVGMDTGQLVSRTIRYWMVVRTRCRI